MSYEIIRDALCIVVRNKGEYGAFFVREGKAGEGGNTRYYCELTIQSSFGNVGHYWHYMGSPACGFLSQMDQHYALGKLFGDDAYVFNAERTELELRRQLLEDRLRGALTKEEARDMYDAIRDLKMYVTLERFCDAYAGYDDLLEWRTIGDIPFQYTLNPQAVGLWEKLWPEFLQALKEEALRPRDSVPPSAPRPSVQHLLEEPVLAKARETRMLTLINLDRCGLGYHRVQAAAAYSAAIALHASPEDAFELARREVLLDFPPRTTADYNRDPRMRTLSDWEVDRAIRYRADYIKKIRELPNPFKEIT